MTTVWLRVYRLSEASIGKHAYHAGVQVNGVEWEYCAFSGVRGIRPGTAGDGQYAEHLAPIFMGITNCSSKKIEALLDKMEIYFSAHAYHIINRNCCTFARRFLEELGVSGMPEWVDTYTGKIFPIAKTAVSGGASAGAVAAVRLTAFGAEGALSSSTAIVMGPACWGATFGDLIGRSLGARIGGKIAGTKGSERGKEVGSFSGAAVTGVAVGGIIGGAPGASIGLGVGVLTYTVGKGVRSAIRVLTSRSAMKSLGTISFSSR